MFLLYCADWLCAELGTQAFCYITTSLNPVPVQYLIYTSAIWKVQASSANTDLGDMMCLTIQLLK